MSAESPDTAVERALVSERLDRLGSRLLRLEDLARSSDARLERLVELAEARDRREEDQVRWEREQVAARGSWLRSIVTREVVLPLVTALAGAITTGAAVYSSMAQPAELEVQAVAPAPPSTHPLGRELGATDGEL